MRLHLISDVPVALFLSSRVDSAALGVLAQRAGASRLATQAELAPSWGAGVARDGKG